MYLIIFLHRSDGQLTATLRKTLWKRANAGETPPALFMTSGTAFNTTGMS